MSVVRIPRAAWPLVIAATAWLAASCSEAPGRHHPGPAPRSPEHRPVDPPARLVEGVHARAAEHVDDPLGLDRGGAFFGVPDHPIRVALATQPIARIEKGRGGRTLAFRLTLADGTVGYYKPEQTFSAAYWHAEVASYYLDRALGLGRVAPTVGRRIDWEALRRVAGGDPRIPEVIVQPDGTVRGAFIAWIEGPLVPLRPGVGWEAWVRVEGKLAITPYQRPAGWARDMRPPGSPPLALPSDDEAEVSGPKAEGPDTPERAAELSDLLLFDTLTNNVDRFGGSFTNVRVRGPRGPLVFLDNGAGFFPGQVRIPLMDARLHAVQRFRRSTVEAIRRFDVEDFRARLATDPLAPVLDATLLEGLEVRRRHLLEHVDAMVARFGERVWL